MGQQKGQSSQARISAPMLAGIVVAASTMSTSCQRGKRTCEQLRIVDCNLAQKMLEYFSTKKVEQEQKNCLTFVRKWINWPLSVGNGANTTDRKETENAKEECNGSGSN